jgi:hypothetical protein
MWSLADWEELHDVVEGRVADLDLENWLEGM